jgi:hypothetical protein
VKSPYSYSKSLSKLKYSGTFLSSRDRQQYPSDRKPSNLQTCLKELKDIKRTIKDLKQTCQDGTNNNRKIGMMNHHTIYRSDHSAKKYMPSSLSKHSYSNYRDLSSGRHNRSQDRIQYSDKKFNWLRNPNVQQFTIDASNDEN